MDFFGAFLSGLLSIVVYIVVFMGVYKLYFIAKDIHEIKELMERKLRNTADGAGAAHAVNPVAELSKGLSEEEAASVYAEQLLRAVSAQPAKETQEVR